MRGFISLEPDAGTLARFVDAQNRLRDVLTRQGVHFTEVDRIAPTLLAWPFATEDEIGQAAERVRAIAPSTTIGGLRSRPNDDRPAEIGYPILGTEALQDSLFEALRVLLDPDPPQAAFARLARVSPPSRKVGAALHGSGLIGTGSGTFRAIGFTFWRQSPTGFERCRTMPFDNGGS